MNREILVKKKKKEKIIPLPEFEDDSKIFLDKMDVRSVNVKKHTFIIIRDYLKDLSLPSKGQTFRIRTQQQMNLISIIMKMVDVHGKIDSLSIATYTLNKEAFNILSDLLCSGRISSLDLIVSSTYEFRDKAHSGFLKSKCLELSKDFEVHLCFAWVHLKITIAICQNEFYQIEGSMNYSTGNWAEQLLLENCEESYKHDFRLFETIKQKKLKSLEIVC